MAVQTKGKFITFEGGEGGGKTTHIKRLKEWIEEKTGAQVITTREPGGTEGAEAIRDLLLKGKADKWDDITEALMFFAARRDHLVRVIWPALERGDWVISDRFVDSTFAYQGYGHGCDMEMLKNLYTLVAGAFKPDLTVVLDLDPREGIARTRGRTVEEGGDENRFENIDIAFHDRLREGYLSLASDEPDRFAVIDASQNIENVWNDILKVLEKNRI